MGRRVTRIALLGALALVLAACGGGSGGQAGQAGQGGGSGPIKLGQIASLTGNYTPLGTNDQLGAAQAVKEINDAGGLLGGRQLEITVRDDKTQPDQAVIAFNDLASQGVVAVVGSSFSNSSLAVIPIAERREIPYVSTAAADEQVEPVRSYAFMTPPTAGVVAEQLLKYFQASGMTRMAVAYDTQSAFAQTGWNKQQAMAAKYGVEFVAVESFETGATNFSSVLTHVRDSGAQGLMVWATGAPAVIITKQFATSGLAMPLVMSHAEASTLYTQPAGPAAEGVIVASSLAVAGPELPASKVKDVVLAMAGPFQEANGYYPPQFAFDGYGAVKLIAAAIEQAGSDDPKAIQQALNNLTLLTPEGEYRYTPQDHSGLQVEDVAITQVQNGQFVLTDWSRKQLESALK
ncbi:ABC transporter substrate-binding protein [Pseudonocardia asaccharolytica]|uniref:Branched-chain amino acid ABC transporter n=1 Tax=Pseudonocardia asaccharolytica DSM 44247 = NBRC 16224 TaxID=1123024 RepID=A0A511D1V2_9PSEU|nr:ABC transporter substrate-binding protein [Pseudonocardia asaccharolytica]GEL16878.1 branched-chain amino acid ABC transporter [Pseudonocardia asaccharolytica DSM 44247 = NBRC 16224]